MEERQKIGYKTAHSIYSGNSIYSARYYRPVSADPSGNPVYHARPADPGAGMLTHQKNNDKDSEKVPVDIEKITHVEKEVCPFQKKNE